MAEAYPDLKADEHFLELQRELAVTEDRIQAARRLFNGNVRDYNQRVQSVPSNLVAAVAGFRRRDYFELEAAVRDAGPPRVETLLMHPAERVRIVTETARAVLESRLDPATGAQTLAHPADPDRCPAPQRPHRRDAGGGRCGGAHPAAAGGAGLRPRLRPRPDPDSNVEMARILGELAQTLR